MIVCIAGTRGFQDMDVLRRAIGETIWDCDLTEVVSGGEPTGVDHLGELWAYENAVPVRKFLPDWNRLGRAAGPARNAAMARYLAEHQGRLLILWDGKSPGTKNMLDHAKLRKIPTFIQWIETQKD